jgi:hypothetical protein
MQPSRSRVRWLLRSATNVLLLTLPSLLAMVLLLELLFRFAIPASEVPTRYFDPDEKMIRFDTSGPRTGLFTRGRWAQLRAHWRINNYGWNSDVDYVASSRGERERPLIAIIGDSYINSFQVDPEKNLAAVLREELEGRFDVYRFGMPGAPLSHYLHMSRYVDRHFDPDVLVFVVVHNDFHLSLQEIRARPYYLQLRREDGRLTEVPPSAPKSDPAPWWLHSATLRYLKITLQSYLLAGGMPAQGAQAFIANIPVEEVEAHRETIREAVDRLLSTIRQENRDRLVIVAMDAPRLDLYAGRIASSRVRWLNELMAAASRAHGIPFLDLTDHFAAVYAERGLRFESPLDAHWNELGHREAARALATQLELSIAPGAGGPESRAGGSESGPMAFVPPTSSEGELP